MINKCNKIEGNGWMDESTRKASLGFILKVKELLDYWKEMAAYLRGEVYFFFLAKMVWIFGRTL